MSWILGIVAVCALGVSFICALVYLAITLFGKAGKHISCFAIPGGCVSPGPWEHETPEAGNGRSPAALRARTAPCCLQPAAGLHCGSVLARSVPPNRTLAPRPTLPQGPVLCVVGQCAWPGTHNMSSFGSSRQFGA